MAFLGHVLSLCAAESPLEIGFVYWRKPDNPGKFDAYVHGMKVAIDEVNAAGGLGGRPLVLKVFDEKGDAAVSENIAERIASSDGIVGVVGFSNSGRAINAIGRLSGAGIPVISSAGSSELFEIDTRKCFFSTNPGVSSDAAYFTKLVECESFKKIIVAAPEDDSYSREYVAEIKRVFPNAVVFSIGKDKAYDCGFITAGIRNSGVDGSTLVVLLCGAETAAEVAAAMTVEPGAEGVPRFFLPKGGLETFAFAARSGLGLKGVYAISPLVSGVSDERIEGFKTKLSPRQVDAGLTEYAAYAYDLVWLMKSAFEKERGEKKSVDLSQIRARITNGLKGCTRSAPSDGIAGSYSFVDRRGSGVTPQYLLEDIGGKPVPYKWQFIPGPEGGLSKLPTLYTQLRILSISPANFECNAYTMDFLVTTRAAEPIGYADIDFENVAMSESTFTPMISMREMVPLALSGGMYSSAAKIHGKFTWDNTIGEFPFDTQSFSIVARPKNAMSNNFLLYVEDRSQGRLRGISIGNWTIRTDLSGFRKEVLDVMGTNGEKQKKYYYTTSYSVIADRIPVGPVNKFLIPLAATMVLALFLILMPIQNAGDVLGASYGTVLAVIALYLSYVTVVNIDYPTLIDKVFLFALGILIVKNFLFVVRQRSVVDLPFDLAKKSRSHALYKSAFYITFLALLALAVHIFRKL